MAITKKICRKEVALLVEKLTGISVSVDQVRKNEIYWGLFRARCIDLNKRVVRYDIKIVEQSIRARFLNGN